MDILAHCRIYPISQYITIPRHKEPVAHSGLVHIILDEIKNKSYQWIHQRKELATTKTSSSNRPTCKLTLVIDLLNVWDDNARSQDRVEDQLRKTDIHIIKDSKYIKFQNLITFLDDEILMGQYLFDNHKDMILYGIIIDNLSIYSFDPENLKLFNKLYKVLERIQFKYGCWIKTISFKDATGIGKYPTRIPIYYLNNMETILVYDNNKFHQLK